MSDTEVRAKREVSTRAGTQVLTLLAAPLNVAILETLVSGPVSLIDLRREVGSPPQTSLRGNLRTLTEIGCLTRVRQNQFPGALAFELAAPGRALLQVKDVLGAWLADGLDPLLVVGSSTAKSVIKALVDGWGTSMLRALAARPLTLTELDSLISDLSYPSIERRLVAMRMAGLVEKASVRGRGAPHSVTPWLRRGIAPLAAAARWERQNGMPDAVPIGRLDVEAALLLAAPLLDLPTELSGFCRVAVEIHSEGTPRLAGAVIEIEEGRVTSCISRLEGEVGAWASGSATDWLEAVMDGDRRHLEVGGDCTLANAVVDGLHGALFGTLSTR